MKSAVSENKSQMNEEKKKEEEPVEAPQVEEA
jgi:hypothetical protein